MLMGLLCQQFKEEKQQQQKEALYRYIRQQKSSDLKWSFIQ